MKKRYYIAFEIALTYKFIHNAGVVHRDIKTYNVILDNALHIKICDFGLARFKVYILSIKFFISTCNYLSLARFKHRRISILRNTSLYASLNVSKKKL